MKNKRVLIPWEAYNLWEIKSSMLAEYIKTFHASKFWIFHISLCGEIPASRNGYTINQPAHLKLHQLYITMMQNSSTIVKEILLLKLMTEIFYLLNSLINHWKHFTTKWKNRKKTPDKSWPKCAEWDFLGGNLKWYPTKIFST